MTEQPYKLYVHAPNAAFVMPYIERELPDVEFVDGAAAADLAVMLSHVDVYGVTEGDGTDESAPLQNAALRSDEEDFRRRAGEKGVIVRTADVIGTGMNGFPMALAREIASGRFFHFPGNEARRSVVHASDVARFIALLVSRNGSTAHREYNLTDMSDPTVHDIAEALAFRMNNKRISTLSTRPQQWLGRVWYGRTLYALYTTTVTYSAERVKEEFGFQPVPVTTYVHTHVYDHNSL